MASLKLTQKGLAQHSKKGERGMKRQKTRKDTQPVLDSSLFKDKKSLTVSYVTRNDLESYGVIPYAPRAGTKKKYKYRYERTPIPAAVW